MIDYFKIAQAREFYENHGYKYIEVPWIVEPEACAATRPEHARPFESFMGNFVASGEQSFIDMMLKGELEPGKYQCITPCFRDEHPDELHLVNFMKLELIHYMPELPNYSFGYILGAASKFLGMYTGISFDQKGKDEIDIVTQINGVELGSYGIRTFGNHTWVYGTGIAEPRLTRAVSLEQS